MLANNSLGLKKKKSFVNLKCWHNLDIKFCIKVGIRWKHPAGVYHNQRMVKSMHGATPAKDRTMNKLRVVNWEIQSLINFVFQFNDMKSIQSKSRDIDYILNSRRGTPIQWEIKVCIGHFTNSRHFKLFTTMEKKKRGVWLVFAITVFSCMGTVVFVRSAGTAVVPSV